MVAWFKWLISSDIEEVLRHRLTAFGMILAPPAFSFLSFWVYKISYYASEGPLTRAMKFIFILDLPLFIVVLVYILLMYIILKSPQKVFFNSIPALISGVIVILPFVLIGVGYFLLSPKDVWEGFAFGFGAGLVLFIPSFSVGLFITMPILLFRPLYKSNDFLLKIIAMPVLLIIPILSMAYFFQGLINTINIYVREGIIFSAFILLLLFLPYIILIRNSIKGKEITNGQ